MSVAIRGTELVDTGDLNADADIVGNGAAYSQIVAMVNWWARVSAGKGQLVDQYRLATYSASSVPPGAVVLREADFEVVVLEAAPPVASTGEVAEALAKDPDLKIDVTGHSLGGHLAMAFSTLFGAQVGQTVVFNAPGFIDSGTNRAFFDALGGVVPTPGSVTNLFNVIADEALIGGVPVSPIAGMHSRPGIWIGVATENQWLSDEPVPHAALNHSMVSIVDSLAVYKLLKDLAPALTEGEYKQIVHLGAQGTAGSYERIVDSLQALFGIDRVLLPVGNGNRERLYQAVYEVSENHNYQQHLGLLEILPTPVTASELLIEASDPVHGLAYRYAIAELSPFVAKGEGLYFDFESGSRAGRLDPRDPVMNPFGLTGVYLQQRAEFLERKLYINGLDLNSFYEDPSNSSPEGGLTNAPDARGQAYQLEARHYVDLESGFVASSGGPENPLQHFIFGSAQGDKVGGGAREDFLYGGAGSDYLEGKGGADYLEGGLGMDAYVYAARTGLLSRNDGDDTILDIDGRGVLVYSVQDGVGGEIRNSLIAGAALHVADSEWHSADGRFSFERLSGAGDSLDLVVTFREGAGGSIQLMEFRDGDFGIYLLDPLTPIDQPARIFFGDKADWDADPEEGGTQIRDDGLGNAIRDDGQDGRGDRPQLDRADTFYGSPGDDVERFLAGGGDDVIYADGAGSLVATTGGRDHVLAGAGDDWVAGGGGNDWLEGEEGSDVLIGGAGNDVLYASSSRDLSLSAAILARGGDGEPAARGDMLIGGEGRDVLIGSALADVLFGNDDDDLIVGGAGDDVIYGDGSIVSATVFWSVERIETLLPSGFMQYEVVFAGVAAGAATGGGRDVIYGGAGRDWIFAGGGNDYVEGGDASDEEGIDDVIFGGAGSDILIGGSGNDVISGDDPWDMDQGDDYLDGGDGDDHLFGYGGNDILVGGKGNDVLAGGGGQDTYVFHLGDGIEVVFDTPEHADASDASIVIFGAGVERSQVVFRPGSFFIDLGGGDGLYFEDWDPFDPAAAPIVQRIHFDDGSSMMWGDVLAQGFDVQGTEGDDDSRNPLGAALVGTAHKDRIHGLGGNDVLDGRQGDDSLYGGDGNDHLFGGEGDDLLSGGEGADVLEGGAGNDRYIFDPLDTVIDVDGLSRIVFQEGIDPENLTIERLLVGAESRLLISLAGQSGPGMDIRGTDLHTERLAYEFADGRTLSQAELLLTSYRTAQTLSGTAADDLLSGYAGDDVIFGGAGNDVLLGYAGKDVLRGQEGDDILLGGAGADELYGGPGSDTYLFGYGDGHDIIADLGTDDGIDVLRLADDVTPDDVTIARQANGDLRVTLNATQESVTIQGWYTAADAATRVERIAFGDGTVLDEAQLLAIELLPISGTSGNDVLRGTAFADMLVGLAGDDTLDGGPGNDTLVGGQGSDTYVFAWGTGRDTLIERPGETSTILLPYGRDLGDLAWQRVGDDLVLHSRGTKDAFQLKEYYALPHDWQLQTYGGQLQSLADFLALPAQTTGDRVLDLWEERKNAIEGIFYGSLPGSAVLEDGRLYLLDMAVRGADFSRSYYNGDVTSGVGGLPQPHVVEEYRSLESLRLTSDEAWQSWTSISGATDMAQSAGTFVVAWDEPEVVKKTSYAGTYVGADLVIRPLYLSQATVRLSGFVESMTLGSSNGASALALLAAAAGGHALPSVIDGALFSIHAVDIIPEIQAGASDNVIRFNAHGFVDAGAGNDVIDATGSGGWTGALLYGNSGDDRIIGSGQGDLIIGGAGNDVLAGSHGDDVYYFFLDEPGLDLVNEATWFLWDTVDALNGFPTYNGDSGFNSTDTVQFGPGITLEELALSWGTVQSAYSHRSLLRTYETLDISWGEGRGVRVMMPDRTDAQVLENMESFPGASWGIEHFRFADGTSLTLEQMASRVAVTVLNGTEGDDYLSGTWGRDLLTGGAGSDYLEGDAGDDTYRFNIGDGEDWIDDREGTDMVVFGPGITPEMIVLGLGSLRLQIGATDVLHLTRFDPDDALSTGSIEFYRFADGTTLSHAQLLERGFDIVGTLSGDVLAGTSVADRMLGLAGNDTLSSGDGDDVLDGGEGSDVLQGGEGSDTYVFGVGSGHDVILETDAAGDDLDVVTLGGGIAPENLQLSRVAQDLVLSADGMADTLTISRWYDALGFQIEQLRFHDGRIWDAGTIALIVPPPNQAPVLAHPIADQQALEDAPFELALASDTFFEPDPGESLTYAATLDGGGALPAWLFFEAGTRTLRGTPGNDDVGLLSVRITATDPSGAAASTVFQLAILNTNDAPVLAKPIADQTAKAGQSFSLALQAGTFVDVDPGDTLAYGASLAHGASLPGWLAFDAQTMTFTGTPADADVGDFDVRVTATDSAGATAADTFRLVVGSANTPPRIVFPLLDRTAVEDEPFSYFVSPLVFFDPDPGDVLTLNAAQADGMPLPAWLAFDGVTRTFSGTPRNEDVGSISVRVTVTDAAGAFASDVFLVSVLNTNDAPLLAHGVPDQEVLARTLLALTLPEDMFVDVDAGDQLTYAATLSDGSPLPGWLSFDPAARSFSGTPTNGDAGAMEIRVVATDGSLASASQVFILTVIPVNTAPLLVREIADLETNEDEFLYFEVPADAFSDGDVDDFLTYSATLADGAELPAWLAFDPVARSFTGSPENEDVGVYTIEVTATDTSGEFATDIFDLTVVNTNDAPVLVRPIADQRASRGQPFSFSLPADTFTDVDVGDSLAYGASLADGSPLPSWLQLDAATRTFSGVPAMSFVGVHHILVTATDESGASASGRFALDIPYAIFGDAADNLLTGTDEDDEMYGYAGNDTLDGGAGADWLAGGPGDDLYYVDDSNDLVVEEALEGLDTVISSVSYALPDHVENLVLSGSSSIDATGNDGDNLIVGNAADNRLAGGAGDDTYVVDSPGDSVIELAGEGVDTVRASIDWTLGEHLENLTLTGSAHTSGHGNALANVLQGNSGNNRLFGHGGDDVLDGAGGSDELFGGPGSDTYLLGRGYGADVIQDEDASPGSIDVVQFLDGIAAEQLWFRRAERDLVVSVIGTEDQFTVRNWYVGANRGVEQFRTSDGQVLLDAQVQNLVNAMAAFAPPASGQETLPPDYAATLYPLIAASWQ
jgi:Ca2+-binding RTX toxin-like protein